MVRFVSCKELYETIQQKSSGAKEILWVCSPSLGSDAHEVLSQEIINTPPADIRFVFRVNEDAVKKGEVDPYEVQYFMEHFKNSSIKSQDSLDSNIYVFDNSTLITSTDLIKTAFESNIGAGVLLDGPEVGEVRNFFTTLWENAKLVKDVKKYKKMWNTTKESTSTKQLRKPKNYAGIKAWTDDYVCRWYFSVPSIIPKRTQHKIQKEANWTKKTELVGDIGPNTFKQVKLGDLAFIADLTKKRTSTIKLRLARIFDKSRVETDEGDLHLAYETRKTYLVEKTKFYEMIKNASLTAKSSEILLDQDQIKSITKTLCSSKARKRHK